MSSFITCPNCGSTISSDAQVCPVCGYQLRTNAGANAGTNNAAPLNAMPTQPMDQSAGPQPGNGANNFDTTGNGVSPMGNNTGVTPAGNNPDLTSIGNAASVTPTDNSNEFPSAGNNAGMPPAGNTPGFPPAGNNGGVPPMGNNNGLAPMGNNGGMPMPPKRSGMAPWLIALIAVLSLVVVVGGFFLFRSANSVRNFSGTRFKSPISYAVKYDTSDEENVKSEGLDTKLADMNATTDEKQYTMYTFYPDGTCYLTTRERDSARKEHAITILKGTYTINNNKIRVKVKGDIVRRFNGADEELIGDKDISKKELVKKPLNDDEGKGLDLEIKGNDIVATNAYPGGDAPVVKMDKPAKPIKNATGKVELESMYKYWVENAKDSDDDDDEDEDDDRYDSDDDDWRDSEDDDYDDDWDD